MVSPLSAKATPRLQWATTFATVQARAWVKRVSLSRQIRRLTAGQAHQKRQYRRRGDAARSGRARRRIESGPAVATPQATAMYSPICGK